MKKRLNLHVSRKIPNILRNRYVVVFIGFIIYITFFDSHDLISQLHIRWELRKIKDQMEYLQKDIQSAKTQTKELTTDKTLLEKFAREQYRMKRENEDVFVIISEDKE